MQTHSADGIILQAINFRDFDQIATIFTENEGVIKVIAKRSHLLKQGLKLIPLTRVEFTFVKRKSELYPLKEMTQKEHYLDLRKDLNTLNTACEFLNAISKTQMLHKPAQNLYKLLTIYLGKIPKFSSTYALECSFRLKVLEQEGILDLCTCSFFSPDELQILTNIANEKSFQRLGLATISKDLNLKVKTFFYDQFY